MIYFIRQKSDTFKATEKFLADSAPYGKVKCLRSDNGTEFTSESFQNLLLKHGIKHEKSAPYSPHQNGTAERGWRTTFEMARCLLTQANLPKNLWSYAVMCAVYIRNRCYNHRLKKTPHETFTGHKPNLQHMHIFGTVGFAYIQEKKKLDDRAEKGIFVGYDKGSPAYLIYYPNSGVIKKCRCVRFTDKFEIDKMNPECIPIMSRDVPCQTELQTVEGEKQGVVISPINEQPGNAQVPVSQGMVISPINEPGGNVQVPTSNSSPNAIPSQTDVEPSAVRYPSRAREKPNYLGYTDNNNVHENDNVAFAVDYCYNLSDVPKTYEQAISSPDASKWQMAMEEEIQALQKNDAFELTSLPEGRKSVGGRWVYALKLSPNGEEKHKHLVYKLKKSLYGLRQSGRNWNSLLHSYLVSEGFKQSQADYCVCTKITDDSLTVIVIWVDDLIIASSSMDTLMNVKRNLGVRFKMKDLGRLSWFLGLEFNYQDGVIMMNQSQFIKRVLRKFNMENCKPRFTPCETGTNKISEDESQPADVRLYREILGSLVYIMTSTRPDLSYSITKLSQHLDKPTLMHLNDAKHVLRNLKGTVDRNLVFRKSEKPLSISGFCDADWGASEDRRSIIGYGFKLSSDCTLISWKSRKQPTIALSTCEAEYMSLAAEVQEGKFLFQLLGSILDDSRNVFRSVTLYCDNQGALALANNPVQHQ